MDPSDGGQEGALSSPSCARKTEHEEMAMLEWEIWRVSNPKSTFVAFGHGAVAAALTLVSPSITERWEHVFHGSLAWRVQGDDSAPSEPPAAGPGLGTEPEVSSHPCPWPGTA